MYLKYPDFIYENKWDPSNNKQENIDVKKDKPVKKDKSDEIREEISHDKKDKPVEVREEESIINKDKSIEIIEEIANDKKDNEVILTGTRSTSGDKLWDIRLASPTKIPSSLLGCDVIFQLYLLFLIHARP